MKEQLDFNAQFTKAHDLLEKTSQSVFVTGKAGTGKSTLLRYFRDNTAKDIVVLAPTGVAAVNIQGQTIHSFFGFKPDITPDAVHKIRVGKKKKALYKNLEAVVIDEISMVRADLLDCVDRFLKIHGPQKTRPFGGLQMIFIGDLYQLPPVVTSAERDIFRGPYPSPYFFDAKVIAETPFEFVELEKIYRQKDRNFILLLNAIRNNSVTPEQLAEINARCDPKFVPSSDDLYIYLTTTNDLADRINNSHLENLKSESFVADGQLLGDFDRKSLPTQETLELKEGAQVMLLNNDRQGRWINGSLGKITSILKKRDDPVVEVELQDGDLVKLTPFTWEMFRFTFDEETQTLASESVGSFTQYPLRLAWAVTIHKSQGKTFSKVVIDIGRGTFSHGQLYVALSRCTTLDGMVLQKPVAKRHILMDWRVVKFLTGDQYRRAEADFPVKKKLEFLTQAIAQKRELWMVYLKASDEKSRRQILPKRVGEMEYLGKSYLGLEAYCFERQDTRIFRVDRILEMAEAGRESRRPCPMSL